MSDHSLSGYSSKNWPPVSEDQLNNSFSDRKAASRAKMGSRDTSIVSSRGLGGRMRERERADTNTLTLNSYLHTSGQYLQSNTSLTNLSGQYIYLLSSSNL